MKSGLKWPMIGPPPCAYACAYVDPVFTCLHMLSENRALEVITFPTAGYTQTLNSPIKSDILY